MSGHSKWHNIAAKKGKAVLLAEADTSVQMRRKRKERQIRNCRSFLLLYSENRTMNSSISPSRMSVICLPLTTSRFA